MTTRDTRSQIIERGASLIASSGLHRTGLSLILEHSGVPKGSFYFYFKSKEDFGVAVAERLADEFAERAVEALKPGHPGGPVEGLREFFRTLGKEAADSPREAAALAALALDGEGYSQAISATVAGGFDRAARAIEGALMEAKESGLLPLGMVARRTADFIINSWQGALIRSAALGSAAPLRDFDQMIFGDMLRPVNRDGATGGK